MADGTINPFLEELKEMKQRMEELFQRNFSFGGEHAEEQTRSEWFPVTDIIDTGREIVYALDLPGVHEKDIQVECKDNRLWVSGTKGEDIPEGESLRIERPQGNFSRIFKLPCPISQDDIKAEFKRGVLRIVVPKECNTTRTRRVFVKQEDEEG
ncbi:MAG: Hsp20/alpha crystallin family protein [Syntrophobacteraceae bacterium]